MGGVGGITGKLAVLAGVRAGARFGSGGNVAGVVTAAGGTGGAVTAGGVTAGAVTAGGSTAGVGTGARTAGGLGSCGSDACGACSGVGQRHRASAVMVITTAALNSHQSICLVSVRSLRGGFANG
jgi:hypothetical protein